MYALLDGVCCEGALVVYDDVVRWADGALETRVRLEIEVEIDEGRDAAVNDGARARIPVLVCMTGIRWIETRMVPFPAYEDAQRRFVCWGLGVDTFERLEDLWQLFVYNFIILALWWVREI